MAEWPKVAKVGEIEFVSHAPWCAVEWYRRNIGTEQAFILPKSVTDACTCAYLFGQNATTFSHWKNAERIDDPKSPFALEYLGKFVDPEDKDG